MARKSKRSRKNHLLATVAGMALASAAITAPASASATTSAHAARAGHHHASSARHKTSRKTHTHKAAHHKKTAVHVDSALASAETPAPVAPSVAPGSAGSAVSAVSPVSAADCAAGSLVPTTANLDLIRAATLCLINQQRAAAGLRPLLENHALDAAAQAHSDDMVSSDYFDHNAPSGADPLSRVVAAGFATVAHVVDLGENIAAGGGSLSTPAVTVVNWMGSPPHRANILDPTFEQTGIGITAAVPPMLGIGDSGATYTQNFATAG